MSGEPWRRGPIESRSACARGHPSGLSIRSGQSRLRTGSLVGKLGGPTGPPRPPPPRACAGRARGGERGRAGAANGRRDLMGNPSGWGVTDEDTPKRSRRYCGFRFRHRQPQQAAALHRVETVAPSTVTVLTFAHATTLQPSARDPADATVPLCRRGSLPRDRADGSPRPPGRRTRCRAQRYHPRAVQRPPHPPRRRPGGAPRLPEEPPGPPRLLDKLEIAGHVRRARSTPDRRQVICFITPRELGLLKKLNRVIVRADESGAAGLKPREQRTPLALPA